MNNALEYYEALANIDKRNRIYRTDFNRPDYTGTLVNRMERAALATAERELDLEQCYECDERDARLEVATYAAATQLGFDIIDSYRDIVLERSERIGSLPLLHERIARIV